MRSESQISTNYAYVPVTLKKDKTMKSDLQFSTNHINVPDLSAFQRIVLNTNGSVTDILESYLSEPIHLFKLSEKLAKMERELPNIKSSKEEPVFARKVLLRGKISRRNFVYAHSWILINNLDERFSHDLLNTKTPIGKLWSQQKVETFKEMIDSGKEPANGLSDYFCVEPEENMLFRTYSVLSQGKPTMIITEKFPESYFRQNFR
jgi:chorismate-pyruvate lyase